MRCALSDGETVYLAASSFVSSNPDKFTVSKTPHEDGITVMSGSGLQSIRRRAELVAKALNHYLQAQRDKATKDRVAKSINRQLSSKGTR